MINTIIFDVDGTLLNTEKAIFTSLIQMLKEITHKTYTVADVRFAMGIPAKDALPKLGISDIKSATNRWYEIYYSLADTIEIFHGIIDLLILLKEKGYTLGTVTSKERVEYTQTMKNLHLLDIFDFSVVADDTKTHKPNAEPMLNFLEKANKKPTDCLYIGDTIYDELCANRAGVKFALASWGAFDKTEFLTTLHLDKPLDLIKYL